MNSLVIFSCDYILPRLLEYKILNDNKHQIYPPTISSIIFYYATSYVLKVCFHPRKKKNYVKAPKPNMMVLGNGTFDEVMWLRPPLTPVNALIREQKASLSSYISLPPSIQPSLAPSTS